jgi:hypothetical protein
LTLWSRASEVSRNDLVATELNSSPAFQSGIFPDLGTD